MSNHKNNHSLRIIGGNWRGRKVSFRNNEEIRPSPDRVRETLFNWLTGYLQNARCLELFAGSGILSFEALSRGAREVTLVDNMQSTVEQLKLEFEKLNVPSHQFQLFNMNADEWLKNSKTDTFDLIFLDPPFDGKELTSTLDQICAGNLLDSAGFIYIESANIISADTLAPGWIIHRQKRAASVHYCLITSN
jgi:16S rRNA (guanine966-N2)-methyltransferase